MKTHRFQIDAKMLTSHIFQNRIIRFTEVYLNQVKSTWLNTEDNRKKPGYYQLDIPRSDRKPLPLEKVAIEDEIVVCNKSALLDRILTIDKELKYLRLKYSSITFTKAKETIYHFRFAWSFYQAKLSKVYRKFQILVESEIYPHLKGLHESLLFSVRVKKTFNNSTSVVTHAAVPLTMIGTIQTIFYICSALLLLTVLVLLLELLIFWPQNIKITCYHNRQNT